MSKVLKWGILGVCTIIVSKDIHKNLWKNLFVDAQEKIFFLKNWQKYGYGNICILWHKSGTNLAKDILSTSNDCVNLIFVNVFMLSVKQGLEMFVEWPLKYQLQKIFKIFYLQKLQKSGNVCFIILFYLPDVPAFNGAGQVTRNIIKRTFISFPVKSWGLEATPLATHTFKRSYKISHSPQL